MDLFKKINQDFVEAFKAREEIRTSTLRLLVAQIKNREIEKRSAGEEPQLTDEEVMQVIRKEVKKRKESIELFSKNGRTELAQNEEQELVVLASYLPQELSREAIQKVVDDLIKSGLTDFASVMREAMKNLKGKADGNLVSEIVKSSLSA
jgi:uncharacterized protein YqeY